MKDFLSSGILLYLKLLARLALRLSHPFIIGIAGSTGKSSTRNAVFCILKHHFKTKAIYGNSETGIPLGILGIEAQGFTPIDWVIYCLRAPFGIFYLIGTTHLVVEMGIDDPYPPKNMEYLLTIIKPDIAISLNISPTHTMQFEKLFGEKRYKDIQANKKREFLLSKLAEEDSKIITGAKLILGIVNNDDTYLAPVFNDFNKKSKVTILKTFGRASTNDVSYKTYKLATGGTKFEFVIEEKDTISIYIEKLALPRVYFEVFAASILVGLYFEIPLTDIKSSLESDFYLPKGRSTIISGINKTTIIDSSYNAYSMLNLLDLGSALSQQEKRSFAFLMGDIRELGEMSASEHEKVAIEILEKVDYLYCVGSETRKYVLPYIERNKTEKGKPQIMRWFANSAEAGKFLQTNLPQNSIILVKGSQNEIFLEEAIKYILADKKDADKLCRQEEYWTRIKDELFSKA